MKRRDVEASIEATIASLRNAIDFAHEQDQRDRDEKIGLHRPRPAEPPQAAKSFEELLEIGAPRAQAKS